MASGGSLLESLEMLSEGDPYARYARLREQSPVQWSPSLGGWVVTRYDEVRAVLQSPAFSARHSAQEIGAAPDIDLGLFGRVPSLATTDPPVHTRLRRLVSRAFTPRSVEVTKLELTRLVDEALARAKKTGRLDVVADMAGPVPSQIIALMLGVQSRDWPWFKKWSDSLFGAFKGQGATTEELAAASDAAQNLELYLRGEIRSREGDDSDLLVRLRDASEEGDRLTEDEVVTAAMLILVGGNETTTGLIVNGFDLLLSAPELRRGLAADRSLVAGAVEEFLRLAGPVHHLTRIATDDVEIGGERMKPGDRVLMLIASADRDDRRFPEPDRIDPGRASEHLAFGRGRHLCLGAPLARLEAQVVFERFFAWFTDFRLWPGHEPRWTGPFLARRVDELALELVAR
jgi:cytochrome P450